MSKGAAPLQVVAPGRSAPRHNLNRGRVIANLGAAAHPFSNHY
jgi:hypothetical protein